MNLVNERFQALLLEKNFPMKVEKGDTACLYKGRLAISQTQMVDFAVSLTSTSISSIAQIVFNNVAYIPEDGNRSQWLEVINQINLSQGLYYYFAIDEGNRVFARYVSEVTNDVDEIFHILSKGGAVIRQAITNFEAISKNEGKINE